MHPQSLQIHGYLTVGSKLQLLQVLLILQVVAATGTLALGIHMPCKTVVFAGDSPYLNSLMYRQVRCVIVEPLVQERLVFGTWVSLRF